MEITRIQKDRHVFEELVAEFSGNRIISPAFLRQDYALLDNKSQYEFSFLADTGKVDLPQKLLTRTEQFEITQVGVFLLNEKTAKPGSGVLQTYPNATVFGGGVIEDLETIYNGKLSVNVNNVKILDGFPMRRFRSVPDTLKSAGNTESSYKPDSGLVDLPPKIRFVGNNQNSIVIDFPSYSLIDITTATAGEAFKLVVYLSGFLISSGTSR
ncbi:MAG: hypothetical protein SF052_15720 [Bacteroidia bacterium]|nr:hypothetical protein [Bacteroidia bacterium]